MITVEVKGPDGSGKSAIAQAIVMLLTEAGLSVTADSRIDMRSDAGLANVLNSLKKRPTRIDVCERAGSGRHNG